MLNFFDKLLKQLDFKFASLVGLALLAGASSAGVAQSAESPKPEAPMVDKQDGAALLRHGQKSALDLDQYEYLLNQLFPIDHSVPLGLDYTMVLRFEPHLHPESQVVIRHWHDGKVEATLQQVAIGNAWRAANGQVVPGQAPDFVALAALVKIRESKILVSPEDAQRWHQAMFPALEQQFGHVRSVDQDITRKGKHQVESTGTRYEVWFIQPDDEVHVVSWDTEVGTLPTGTFALAKWMNSIRFYAQNHWVGKEPPKQMETKAPTEAPETKDVPSAVEASGRAQ